MGEIDEAIPPSSFADGVAVLARTGRDAILLSQALDTASIAAVSVRDWTELTQSIDAGIAALVLTEESLTHAQMAELSTVLSQQPPWSELPVLLLLAAEGRRIRPLAPELSALLASSGVIAHRRPVATVTLITSVRAALQARRRQCQVRDLLVRARAARDEAEAATRMKDEFLAVISHELRTPVSAILLWTGLLKNASANPEQTARALASITRSAQAQQQLIEDLLDVGRMLTGKLRIETKSQALAPILEAAVDTLRPAATAKGVRLELCVEPGIEQLPLDADRMQQVFWNLIGNAVKFTPAGGNVVISSKREPECVRVTVRDSGQGIGDDVLPHVFDRFTQEDATSTRRHGGLGLGLAIVRQLVEMHGGKVDVASEGKGKGAVATVDLPLAPEQRLGS